MAGPVPEWRQRQALPSSLIRAGSREVPQIPASPREQSDARRQGAPEVVRWMLTEGRHNTHAREFGEEMCQRIVAAGIPIWRGFCFVATLHPEVAATAYMWN